MKRTLQFLLLTLLTLLGLAACRQKVYQAPAWPAIARETKPWSRWWWHGSSVTKEGITAEMEAYKKAGLGGLEITPIYGVYGDEKNFVNYLSPSWMELLLHTLREAERLDMGIDMATGTGWPFGGPWVTDADACKNIEHTVYELKEGESITGRIEFIQAPFLRAVGNPVYEAGRGMRVDPKKIDIARLRQPISANSNLQELALDQVKFERPLRLVALRAFNERGDVVELMDKLQDGRLPWKAPAGSWKVYAIFEGWHGKMVERAGPGGEGNVIDHFSPVALKNYLAMFDSAMAEKDITSLRAFFNDSYEVDDARGAADWTPALFTTFKQQHGYDLRDHIPHWLGTSRDTVMNQRVLSDYRETISELVLTNFTLPWKAWAHGKNAIIRNQAHGSPANILDLYAAVDIPEIEGTEPLRIRMASSAGNVTGKKLVSSESATWLDEHFESNLGDVKGALDLFFLNGINHVFYHGTCYSPPGEAWPGRLFYAAMHLNPRNALWHDFHALNAYATRCQSLLQRSRADHDVLLYFPIYDRFATHGVEMIEHFDGVGKQFEHTAFRKSAELMLDSGYTFDFISDKQIGKSSVLQQQLITEGNAAYKVIVIPRCRYMPLETLQRIHALAESGATVIFYGGLPQSYAGYKSGTPRAQFEALLRALPANGEGTIGKGRVLVGDNLRALLTRAGVERETMVDAGLRYSRRITPEHQVQYFISNATHRPFEGWVSLGRAASSVAIIDPVSGEAGKAAVKAPGEQPAVYLQLQPAQSIFLNLYDGSVDAATHPYVAATGDSVSLQGPWTVSFVSGGPSLPPTIVTGSLASWTNFEGDGYATFSGTARYSMEFGKPALPATVWLLDLGDVRESAQVVLNGKSLGTLLGPSYQVKIDPSWFQNRNTLEVHVSNLMANRIIDLDNRNVFWKKFYNVNFPARKPANAVNGLFSAAHAPPRASGLVGPVRLKALVEKVP